MMIIQIEVLAWVLSSETPHSPLTAAAPSVIFDAHANGLVERQSGEWVLTRLGRSVRAAVIGKPRGDRSMGVWLLRRCGPDPDYATIEFARRRRLAQRASGEPADGTEG